ncbi:uridine kinase family protein [Rubrolithibacter danxiaensis]|uniref:uridine kinase family protein n=1 Tax=Rubrolithibacter danxiaensis TaxID=3390805 RepID=UPI003BF8F561
MNKPFIIGITGGSGSGKTFFLNCFLHHFKKSEITLISQDDYYIPVGDLSAEENKLYNFDLPSAIDQEHFIADVLKLIKGEKVQKQQYTFNNPAAKSKTLEIFPAPILIIEGLFILYIEKIASLLDLTIFIDADNDIALQRRLERDKTERGYSHEDILYKWINHVVPAYEEFLLPYKSTCHTVIQNNAQSEQYLIELSENISKELKKRITSL